LRASVAAALAQQRTSDADEARRRRRQEEQQARKRARAAATAAGRKGAQASGDGGGSASPGASPYGDPMHPPASTSFDEPFVVGLRQGVSRATDAHGRYQDRNGGVRRQEAPDEGGF
jgi:hypothetical protein